ncbi:MAG TPA: SGNH/GDSL hydrolase family protein [Longimicrobiales bacterium]|nr:SGNH/GDSL hydrolase family protein [Longimicrobiales bacterium]
MPHLVLLGDSIFDNAAYVAGGPSVVDQLRAVLPEGWAATLRARDGSYVCDVAAQLRGMPEDATHLVVSAGGNDAIDRIAILEARVRSVAEALDRLDEIGREFDRRYRTMLRKVLDRALPTAVCTIYDPRFPDRTLRRLTRTGLAVFNDRILRSAFRAGLPVLDLRLLCAEDADYANPIEPSVHGGEKIARGVVRLAVEHDFRRSRTEVFSA